MNSAEMQNDKAKNFHTFRGIDYQIDKVFPRGNQMIDLKDYPGFERIIRGSPDLGMAFDKLSGLYKDTRRLSGRLVVQHCLETGEITSWYTSDPVYLASAILHDIREDLNLCFEDVKRISGKDGVRVAQLVTALSKRADLKDRAEREREYTERIVKEIEKDHWLSIIKLSDRLSNLTDILALPPEKRRAIAMQTIEFYVPIALRLGIRGLANELRALSLPHVDKLTGFCVQQRVRLVYNRGRRISV